MRSALEARMYYVPYTVHVFKEDQTTSWRAPEFIALDRFSATVD
jgi:hypothetical protein